MTGIEFLKIVFLGAALGFSACMAIVTSARESATVDCLADLHPVTIEMICEELCRAEPSTTEEQVNINSEGVKR